MPRLPYSPLLISGLLALAGPARGQTAWQGEFDRPVRRDELERHDREEPKPLSPNLIVGEVLRVDPAERLAVIRLDLRPTDPDALLVARDGDCTPQALMRPVRTSHASTFLAMKITRGEARPGMEVVLPAEPLLKECRAHLPAREGAGQGKTAEKPAKKPPGDATDFTNPVRAPRPPEAPAPTAPAEPFGRW